MTSNQEEKELLNQLLIEAENDDTQLYELAITFVYLMASSNINLINNYKDKVLNAIDVWRGTYKLANALYYFVNGYALFFLSKPKEGLAEFSNMFNYCDDTELFRRIKGAGYMGQAVCDRSLGRFDKTLENCLSGTLLINNDDAHEIWHVYIYRMLGEIHTYIGELEEATNYYLKAKSIMDSIESQLMSTVRFRVNDALGNCYSEMGKAEEAEKYLRAAMNEDNLSQAEEARVRCDFGILYLDEPEKALTFFEESCTIRKGAKLEDAYTTSLIYLGECHLKLGNIEKAETVLNEAVLLVDKYNVPSKRLHMYQQFAALNQIKGDYKEANNYLLLYDKLKTSIHLEQNKNIFQLKNKRIADQHQEIEHKHAELKETISELVRIKVSRKAMFFSIITVVVLVILTEVFLEPLIEVYSMNQYISIASKILIAFLLKPIDSLYERLLFRKAYRT